MGVSIALVMEVVLDLEAYSLTKKETKRIESSRRREPWASRGREEVYRTKKMNCLER